jgi:hypothetical protein
VSERRVAERHAICIWTQVRRKRKKRKKKGGILRYKYQDDPSIYPSSLNAARAVDKLAGPKQKKLIVREPART